MKKHSLFKVILIVLGSLMVVSAILSILGYIIPSLKGTYTFIPLFDVFTNFVQSFYYFFDVVVFLLVLGAFYGVLNEIPAYKKLLDNIVQKIKNKGNIFVFVVAGLFAILTSVTGQVNVLLVFVPFVMAIILLLGYDKLVAISATIVAMLVGFVGGIYLSFRDATSYYGYSATTIEKMTNINLTSTLWAKIALLILGTALLIFFINRYIGDVKSKKVKYEINDSNEVAVSEVKGDYKNIKTWPMIVIFAFMFVLLILGMVPWNTLFGIKCFDNFNTWLTGLKIGEFSVFNSLISNYPQAFGNWASLGNYIAIIVIMMVFIIIIKFVYKIKFNDVIVNFVSGSKKMLSTVFLVVLSCTILVCTYNHGFMGNIITWIAGTKVGLNIATTTIISALGTLLHTDLYYTVSGVYNNMITNMENNKLLVSTAINFQSVYGITSILAPTSFLVIFALKYLDVPYTTWVKYIWRFVLMLLLLVILVLLVVTLL